MKVIASFVVVAFLAVTYSAYGTDIICPAENGENVTLIANPANCTTYFACDRGVPIEMLCPLGLHFNDAEKTCDWPLFACCDPEFDPEHRCPSNQTQEV